MRCSASGNTRFLRWAWIRRSPGSSDNQPADRISWITRQIRRPYIGLALAALTTAGAAIRFSTLGVQSYWDDEAATVFLVKLDLWNMLQTIPKTESTPPLYYLLAWSWARLFGTGEAALRFLSALFGAATIPVVYAAAKQLVSRRAALVAAALVAFNPFLVWYAQEARSYALFTFLCALSFLFFVQSLRARRARALWCWAFASALALTSHYFAVFLVAPEAAWLLIAGSRRAAAIAVVGIVAIVGVALLPLAHHQQTKPELAAKRARLITHGEASEHAVNALGGGGISETTLPRRLARIPKQFLVGLALPAERELSAVAGLLVLAAIWLLARRATGPERRGAAVAAFTGTAMIGIPIALVAVGQDHVVPNYMIGAIVPWAIVIATGFAATRTGLALTVAVCLLALAIIASVATTPRHQRANWRGAARALGPAHVDRAIIVTPGDITSLHMISPLPLYQPELRQIPLRGARVLELDILAVRVADRALPRSLQRPPTGRARLVERINDATFTLVRFVYPQPVQVTRAALLPSHFGDWSPHRVTVFIQPA
jgi:mannosyltransferase